MRLGTFAVALPVALAAAFAQAGGSTSGAAPAMPSTAAGEACPPERSRCELVRRSWPERLDNVRKQAQESLRLVDYQSDQIYDAAPGSTTKVVAVPAPGRRRAILSYPHALAGTPLYHRAFLYDQALGLLWFTSEGNEPEARGLAATLLALQNDDGTWGFSFSVDDGFYNAAYVRSGTVAWVAYALAIYARRFADQPAAIAAGRAGRGLWCRRITKGAAAGLIKGGRGRWSEDWQHFLPAFRLEAGITEHQFDAHAALSVLAPGSAVELSKRILAALWLDNEGRFAVASDGKGPDRSRALDAAGGWGALWLEAMGDLPRARRSLSYTVNAFVATQASLSGYRPYLDPVDGPTTPLDTDLIFVEGSLGVALAAHRLGESALADAALHTVVTLGGRGGQGIPVANRPARDFPDLVGAAPTLWFLFLEKEMRTGVRGPLFPRHTESPTK